MSDQARPITWRELKEFVNSLSEAELETKVNVFQSDNVYSDKMNEPSRIEDDIYADKWSDNLGTMKELKEWYDGDDEFIESDCKIVTPKGTPFLWID